jgi:excisionase family DNA binding protein
MTDEAEKMLTLKEVAARLGLSYSQVKAMARLGELPATRVGFGRGVWRVSVTALHGYVAKRTVAARAA